MRTGSLWIWCVVAAVAVVACPRSASADSVQAWGWNIYGQIGDGTSGNNRTTPYALPGLSTSASAVAAGQYHSLAVRHGAAFAWGRNLYRQLGDGTMTDRTTPVAVSGMSSLVTAVAAVGQHSLAIRNGPAYAWGYNNNGQLGDNTVTNRSAPFAVSFLSTGVTDVAAGYWHSLAVKDVGVWAWGDNAYGQLGDGTTQDRLRPVRVDAARLTDIVAVAATARSSFALSADGSLWVWGGNGAGELGLGDTMQYLTPQHLLPPEGYIFTSIDGDGLGSHVLATLAVVPEPGSSFTIATILAGMCLRRRRSE